MAKLTKAEMAWLNKVQAVLDECPSDRIGFYTIGDASVEVYDRSKEREIDETMWGARSMDFGAAVLKMKAAFEYQLDFPACVHSVSG